MAFFDDPKHIAKQKATLRSMIEEALTPQAVPIPEETVAIAKQFTRRARKGTVVIDWQRIERENALREQLYALALEHQRRKLEFEEDEEDVALILASIH
jgi:hypothetical protein